MLGVTAVQAVGDRGAGRAVALDRSVEQVERHPPDLHPPGAHGDRVAGEVDHHPHPGVDDGQAGRVEPREPLDLVALRVEALTEVALGVEQADGDHGHTEVARRLQMVAGEHAEAAAVLGQRLAQPELRGEVGDEVERRAVAALEPAGLVERPPEASLGRGRGGDDLVVRGELRPPVRRDGCQQPARVVPARLPGLGVEAGEEMARLAVPGPVQVRGELVEGSERRWHGGVDGELADCSHAGRGYPTSLPVRPRATRERLSGGRWRRPRSWPRRWRPSCSGRRSTVRRCGASHRPEPDR